MTEGKPAFAINAPGERVADAINGMLGHFRGIRRDLLDCAIATAYFNPGGFLLLAEELEQAGTVRLLLGAEPPTPERRVRALSGTLPPARAAYQQRREALSRHKQELGTDRDLLGSRLRPMTAPGDC